MIAEKLLLHVLIVLAPVLSFNFLFANKKIGKSPYLTGILYGISASVCMNFAFFDHGLYWDLRYIPLVLSIFYGGPISGLITLFSILVTRTFMDETALVFGYMSAVLAATIPFLLYKWFWKLTPKQRVQFSILSGFWPALVKIILFFTYQAYIGSLNVDEQKMMFYISIFGGIQIIGVVLAARLNEVVIEQNMMKDEIRRSEKQHTIGELAATIAHEVRNPLTVVKGFLQLMEGEDERHKHYYPLILSELGRAESIISDYLNFAKPEFKKIETFLVAELVVDVSLLLNPLALRDGVTLIHTIESDAELTTDRNQMKQALINLLKNAVEASPKGGRVSIKLTSDQNAVKIVIRDTGKGMTREQISRIGTLYYSTKEKGTGLGTMVSLRILESMGGKVEYTSKEGKGTKVSVTLPLHPHNEEV